jgi:hypothetical protein
LSCAERPLPSKFVASCDGLLTSTFVENLKL